MGSGRTGSSELSSPPKFTVVWVTPQLVLRFRPRGASFRERARPLRMPPTPPLGPCPRPLPFLARGAHGGRTPCRHRQAWGRPRHRLPSLPPRDPPPPSPTPLSPTSPPPPPT